MGGGGISRFRCHFRITNDAGFVDVFSGEADFSGGGRDYRVLIWNAFCCSVVSADDLPRS